MLKIAGKSDKTLITLNTQYILHLKIPHLKQLFNQVYDYGGASSNHNKDMTIVNSRMFGIMFEVSLLFASFKISTFMNKPLFIHTCEKL